MQASIYNENDVTNKVTTIVFRPEEDNKTILETDGYESSLFRQQYVQTLSLLQRIWGNKDDEDGFYDSSNVVAFCGDRGEGKTSCLRSVRHMLINVESLHKMTPFVEDLDLDANASYALKLLDPSFFDDTHNVIELVMGQLYEVVMDDTALKSFDIDQRKPLIQRFQKAKACMTALKMKREARQYDEIEELSYLAASVQLRNAINDLFKCFLKYARKKKLLICIDDLDMNMEFGYQMVEDIRKYLCNSNCIIFVAVKVEQLTRLVQASMEEAVNRRSGKRIISEKQIEIMAQKYVDKFIPENHRIKMPTSHFIAEQKVEVHLPDGSLFRARNASIKETIVQLIFEKTRYLFYNGRTISPIVPNNLRAICQLLGLLVSMPDLPYGEDNFETTKTENKRQFRAYFFQSWIKNLAKEDQPFAIQLPQYEDVISVNKFVVTYLGTRLSLDINDDLYRSIISKRSKSHNISLGDVYYVLRLIDAINTDRDIELLLFFVRAFYSMCLYARYDELIDSLPDEDNDILTQNQSEESVTIYKYDKQYENTNTLQKLLNGSYFTYKEGTFITDSFTSKDSPDLHRDRKPINGLELGLLLIELNKELEQKPEITKDSDLYRKLLRCEYFILTTTYQIDTSKAKNITVAIDRDSVEPPFIGEYDNIKRKYLAFDFLSIFYNIVNVQYAYKKFGIEGMKLWEYVKEEPLSLYSQMVQSVLDARDLDYLSKEESRHHQLLSDAVIRVSEVQLSIVDTLNSNRRFNKHRDNGDNTYKLQWAYDDVTTIGISLQPNFEGEKYQLSFDYLQPIIRYLREENEVDFNKIYCCNNIENATIDPEEFARNFPTIHNAAPFKHRFKAIEYLRKDAPKLPKDDDPFWNAILSKDTYRGKKDILQTCLANYYIIQQRLQA